MRAIALSLALLTGCYAVAVDPLVPPEVEYCESIDYPVRACEAYYSWEPGFYVGGMWHRPHYVVRPGYYHRAPGYVRPRRWR